jgi:hypothetical protein
MNSENITTVIYAPNIHIGGGYVLLKELILAWPHNAAAIIFLDGRVKGSIELPASFKEVYWVYPTIWSRLVAEYKLWRMGLRVGLIFCCNGLPPLLPSPAKVVSNLQNINYLKKISSVGFSKKVVIRLFFEQLFFRFFNTRIDQYFVQTKSMRNELVSWRKKNHINNHLDCIIFPYSRKLSWETLSVLSKTKKEWDFVYISDGVAHKNHRNLFEAWRLLAEDGIFPSLAITLSSKDSEIEKEMVDACASTGAKIHNLGHISHDSVLNLYVQARALIYPSLRESFGLPLIEANFFELPILAPELDYVRDICTPTQTFAPLSPLSIARAVKRFLGINDENNQVHIATEFVEKLLASSYLFPIKK